MTTFLYPSSAKALGDFIERMRRSPQARVDVEWLVKNIGISQASNAGRTLAWLKGCGILDEGGALTPGRGHVLLTKADGPERQTAVVGAIEQLIGKDAIDSIRAGTITKQQFIDQLTKDGIGESAIHKGLAGLASLAQEAGDTELIGFFKTRTVAVSQNRAAKVKVANSGTAKPGPLGEPPLALLVDTSVDTLSQAVLPDRQSSPAINGQIAPAVSAGGNAILNGQVLQIRIDASWQVDDIRSVIRMLQLVERGELLPDFVDVGDGQPQ